MNLAIKEGRALFANWPQAISAPQFDLGLVMERVACEHPVWSENRLRTAELEYLQYMAMCKLHTRIALIPTIDADEVWHCHVLHTRQYREDCQNYFGYFLDHEPFNRKNVKFPITQTVQLFRDTFGVEYNVADLAECTNCNCTGGPEVRAKSH
jgi:hypothetical protein